MIEQFLDEAMDRYQFRFSSRELNNSTSIEIYSLDKRLLRILLRIFRSCGMEFFTTSKSGHLKKIMMGAKISGVNYILYFITNLEHNEGIDKRSKFDFKTV